MKTIITDKWNEYLTLYDDNRIDVYYTEEYVKLYERADEKALCAICRDENKTLIFPFLRRQIGDFFDFETAYGYGGPVANTDNTEWIRLALEEMQRLFEKENYICGFIRFHSLLDNASYCKEHINILFDRHTVSINTKETEEQIWNGQISSKNRNMIRKAEKNGLVYKAEYDFESLPQFVSLYNKTMDRLKADEFYYFDDNYYKCFAERLKNNAFLGTVRADGELVCAALFMYSKKYGHYHLEGSNYEYSSMAANNYLLWKTAIEMHKLGINEFHLGGGYNSDQDNSLLKFKKAFSKNMKDFYIGKWIFNLEKYNEIRQSWAMRNPDKIDKYGNLLLCYRY